MNKLLKLTILSLLLGLTYQAHTKELSDKFLRQISEKYALPETPMPVSSIRYYQEQQHFTQQNENSEPILNKKYNLITDINIQPTQYRNIFQIDTHETFAINGDTVERFSSLDLYPGFLSLIFNGLIKYQTKSLFISHLPSQWQQNRVTPFEIQLQQSVQTAPDNWKHGKTITWHSVCKAFPAEAVQDYPQLFPKNVKGMGHRVECTSLAYNQKNQLFRKIKSVGLWLENYQLLVPVSEEAHLIDRKSLLQTNYRMLDFKP